MGRGLADARAVPQVQRRPQALCVDCGERPPGARGVAARHHQAEADRGHQLRGAPDRVSAAHCALPRGVPGLVQDTRRPWTPEEREFVGEHAGTRTAKWMGKHLERSTQSVQSFMNYSSISRRVLEGYSLQEVVALMGVSFPTAQRWLQLGLVTARDGRVTESRCGCSSSAIRSCIPCARSTSTGLSRWCSPAPPSIAVREIAQKGFVPPAAMPVSSVKQEVAEFQSGASA